MGKTIVFVSHDLSSISKYCDRVYLLNQGNILGEGSPKAMIDTYKEGIGWDSIGRPGRGSGRRDCQSAG